MATEQRTFHNDATSIYNLPNDLPEHSRLDEQAKHVSTVMNHRILHSPLHENESRGKRILDIGCGTGYVADTLSLQFPDAQVFGLDLSPVPYRPGRGSNIHFLQGNILNQAPSAWTAQPSDGSTINTAFPDSEAFDLLFSRFLIAGISDWPSFIATEYRLLKPGGWAEIHELDATVYNAADEPVSSTQYWHTIPEKASEASGLEYQCGWRAAARMKAVGFVDVSVQAYGLPLGGEGEATEELRAAGEFFQPTFTAIREVMIRKYTAQSAEEEERMLADMRRGMAKEVGKHYKVVVTYGRKP